VDSSTTLGYTRSLAEARSCLAALADASPFERSVEYEQLLLELEAMRGGHGPATFPVPGSLSELHQRVEARLKDLSDLGADPLRIELILALLNEIRTTGGGGSPE
jgi:hypothetical protein